MEFTLSIKTGNASFADEGGAWTLASAVAMVAQDVRDGALSGVIRDPDNGQVVGHYKFDRRD